MERINTHSLTASFDGASSYHLPTLIISIILAFLSASAHADFYNKDCENIFYKSFMFTEQNCKYSNVSAGILWNEERICTLSINCRYPSWHPRAGEKAHTNLLITVMAEDISKMRWCLDSKVHALGSEGCTALTLRDYTSNFRKAMIDHARWAKNSYEGECSHLDWDADTHWCRWDKMIRRIYAAGVPGSGYSYRDAYNYAKNIADTKGWENWKKMVRLIEGQTE